MSTSVRGAGDRMPKPRRGLLGGFIRAHFTTLRCPLDSSRSDGLDWAEWNRNFGLQIARLHGGGHVRRKGGCEDEREGEVERGRVPVSPSDRASVVLTCAWAVWQGSSSNSSSSVSSVAVSQVYWYCVYWCV